VTHHHPAWLLDQTENFIRKARQHNFVLEFINNLDQGRPLPSAEAYSKALSFSFQCSLGLDIFADCEALHQQMTDERQSLPFGLESLNQLTDGGVQRKTMNLVVAPTNVGKSAFLCHLAADYVRQGRDVLYITLEMDNKQTAHRILANLLGRDMSTLKQCSTEEFARDVRQVKAHFNGNLRICEYPTGTVGVSQFRSLLDEFQSQQKFVPEVILVDYLNLLQASGSTKGRGSYEVAGSIAVDLRGLATEKDIVLWTATQTNRSGYENHEPDLKATSESYQVNSTADLIFGIDQVKDLEDTLLVKLLKNRNAPIPQAAKRLLTFVKSKMTLMEPPPHDLSAFLKTSTKPKAGTTTNPRAIGKSGDRTPRFLPKAC
jgi:replicative DNA helicase